MIKRSFLPVGQGAFYTEQFTYDSQKVNVIYDCGSTTDIKKVEEQIENRFSKNEIINAVFLSHLDRDHINGLPYLLKYCIVKNLFFPLITKESKGMLRLYDSLYNMSSEKNDFFTNFLVEPHEAFATIELERDHYPRLCQINDKYENRDLNDDDEQRIINSGEDVAPTVWNIEKERDQDLDWLYIPFNFNEETRCSILKEELKKRFDGCCSCDILLKRIQKEPEIIEKIKEAYRKVPGNFNTNSMVLFSGSQNYKIHHMLCLENPCYLMDRDMRYCDRCCNFFLNGCLYMGDYDASGEKKWRELYNAYGMYFKCVGCIQIPHHGSRHNYNHKLLGINKKMLCIISAGEKNKYQHPHAMVLKDILSSHLYPLIVNEHSESIIEMLIS